MDDGAFYCNDALISVQARLPQEAESAPNVTTSMTGIETPAEAELHQYQNTETPTHRRGPLHSAQPSLNPLSASHNLRVSAQCRFFGTS
jgi:hypothetical protein